MDNTITIDFYLYGVLDVITQVLNALNVNYSVETTTNYAINFKRLTIPNNKKLIDLITALNDYLENN